METPAWSEITSKQGTPLDFPSPAPFCSGPDSHRAVHSFAGCSRPRRAKHLGGIQLDEPRIFIMEILLVGGWPTPLQNMKVSWGYYSQYDGKNNPFMFQTTNQIEIWPFRKWGFKQPKIRYVRQHGIESESQKRMRVSPQTLMFAWIWFWHLENLNKNQQKGIQGTVMRIEASVKTHVSIRSQYGDFSNMNKELGMNHQDSRKNNEDQKMGCIWFFKQSKQSKTIKNNHKHQTKHLISIDIYWYLISIVKSTYSYPLVN